MPPKRKGAKGAAPRAKRPRAASPIAEVVTKDSEDVHEHDAEGDVDADADGEAEDDERSEPEDKAHDEPAHQDVGTVHHGHHGNDAEEGTAPAPPLRRGRGRPRKTRGGPAPPTRSSPRKAPHTQLQSSPEPAPKPPRGRRPGRPRGRGRGVGRGAAPERVVPEHHDDEDDADADADADGEADDALPQQEPEPHLQTSHQQHQHQQPVQQPLPQPPPQQQQPPQQHQHHQQAPPPPTPGHPPLFAHHIYPPYPSYPSHAPPYNYPYPASDGRPYLPLRPDAAQPAQASMFPGPAPTPQTSFATTFSYDGAPQGNPFPQFGTVYGVGPEQGDEDDDEDDESGQRQGSVQSVGQVRKPTTGKAGGRAGRGDHVACHFCRGRKLKCDGRRPTCGHCALRSLACAYDETVRRRGPGKKEKNARRNPRGTHAAATASPSQAHDVVVPDLAGPAPPPPPSDEPMRPNPNPKRRRRPPPQSTAPPQTGVLRFEHDDTAKPASAAYGVESNERLGYYYAPEGGYTLAPAPGWYGRDGEAEGEGDAQDGGEYTPEGEGARVTAPQGQPYGPHEGAFAQWPAEPPGGQHM